MQVAEIMTSTSVTESPADSLRSAAETMWRQQTGSLLVMDGDQLVGIITERDVMKAIAQGRSVDTPVSDVMTRDVLTIAATTSLHDAARQMASRWIRHLPVVDGDGGVVGLVSQRDLVGVFAALVSDPDGVQLESEQLVRSQRLARIEHGDLD